MATESTVQIERTPEQYEKDQPMIERPIAASRIWTGAAMAKRMSLGWLCASLLALGMTATASRADDPEPPPPDIPNTILVADLQESAPSLDGVSTGTAFISLNDVPFVVSSVSRQIDKQELSDGVIHRLVERSFDFGLQNTLTLVSDELLVRTGDGSWAATATVQIAGGTGMFTTAQGGAQASGQIQTDGSTLNASWNMRGIFQFLLPEPIV